MKTSRKSNMKGTSKDEIVLHLPDFLLKYEQATKPLHNITCSSVLNKESTLFETAVDITDQNKRQITPISPMMLIERSENRIKKSFSSWSRHQKNILAAKEKEENKLKQLVQRQTISEKKHKSNVNNLRLRRVLL